MGSEGIAIDYSNRFLQSISESGYNLSRLAADSGLRKRRAQRKRARTAPFIRKLADA
jgi:hypothetical protein